MNEIRPSFLIPCPDIKKTLGCIKINWKNRQLSIGQSLFSYGIIFSIFNKKLSPLIDYGLKFVKM